MDEENKIQNWTSLDLYYKGFHVKKSISENITPESLIKKIEGYLEAGFLPSWNQDTNKTATTTVSSPKTSPETLQSPTDTNTTHCQQCGLEMVFKSGTNKNGKPFKGYFCPSNQGHPVIWTK